MRSKELSPRRRFELEALEPRLLYSADLGPSLLAAPLVSPLAEHRLLEPEPASALELVFVDAATPDADRLITDIAAQGGRTIEVVRIGAAEDGLARIGAELAARHDVSAVHILAHGAAGAVQLGASVLDLASLEARAAEFAGWAGALTAEADVLIYGCDVAGSEAGRALLERLAALTGADVAASVDATGHVSLGGDWDLEYATAAIETRIALGAQGQEAWLGLLPVANAAASQDTYIMAKSPDDANNFGAATSLIADRDSGDLHRILLQFDLSAVPAGATVNSATLQLQATQIGGALNIDVYELLEGWSEGAGNGTPGAANWNDRAPATAWTTPGGAFNATAVATINANAVGQHSWSVAGLVQAWVDGSKANNGLMVASPDGGGNRTVTYDSRETAAGTAPVLVIDYTFTNSAPLLDAAKAPVLAAVNEDAGAPVGAVGTLVSSLVDFALPAGQVDNVSDTDPGAQLGIAITGADASNGSWWYSTNGGTNWNALGAVSDTAARLLAADLDSRVYFQPNADFNGAIAAALTFRAWDQTSATAAGGIADTATVPASVRDNFTAVSYTNNDGTSSWSGGWVDTDADPAAGNIRVSGGQLAISSALATTQSIYRQANLAAATSATLSFSYDNQLALLGTTVTLQASANGGGSYTNLATFSSANAGVNTFSVDLTPYVAADTRIRFVANSVLLGGTLSVDNVEIAYTTGPGGSTAFSAATDTASLVVSSVNDAPAGVNNTVTVLEDGFHTFGAGEFGFSDVDGNALAAVRIATLPGAGTLENNGAAVGAGQSIALADIAAGLLTFTPAANASGTGYASFTFQVRDDGGTANGGVDLDPSARTMTIDVTAVNDAPAGVSNTVTVLEDGFHTFGAGEFGFSDVDGNALAAVRIATLPGAGTLENNGAAVGAGQSIALADIAAGLLTFTPAANASGTGYASFTFQVRDDGGTANGGVDLDPSARTMTIDVTAVNDAPAGVSNTVTVLEDGFHTFGAGDFGFADGDGNAFLALQVSTLPAAGTLTENTVAVTAGQSVPLASIAAGLLRFTPASGASGTGYASFTFQVQDDGGTANGGADLDPTARTLTVDVTAAAPPLAASPPPLVSEPPPPPPPAAVAPVPEPAPPVVAPAAEPAVVSGSPAGRAATPAGSESAAAGDGAGAAGVDPVVVAEAGQGASASAGSAQRLAAAAPVAAGAVAFAPDTQIALEGEQVDLSLFGLVPTAQIQGGGAGNAPAASGLASELDRVRDELEGRVHIEQWITGSIAAGGFSLTVGYVLWLLRGGALLASLLSTLPAWRLIDPLPILARVDEDADDESDDDAFASFVEDEPAPQREERA